MHIDEHEDWFDGFESWKEVRSVLQQDWLRIEDLHQRLTLHRDLDELMVIEAADHRLRAQQRRSLHRLGFRPLPAGSRTAWKWEAAEAFSQTELAAFTHPAEAVVDSWDPAARAAAIHQLRTRLARAELQTQRAQQVVRDVFRSAPAHVAVVVYLEPDCWLDGYDDEDERWQLPTG